MYIKIGGQNASEEIMDCLESIEVESNILLPDVFAIHLHDPDFKWIDSNTFDLGKAVEIEASVATAAGQNRAKILTGEITAIEPRFNQVEGPFVIIRGYSKAHRLHRVKHTRSFVQQSDSDIASRIAQEHGLKANVDSTSGVNEYVFQDNQTNMEFLQDRAKRNGYYLYIEADTLNFVKAPKSGNKTPVLEWGDNLLNFESRLSTSNQVDKVTVRAWDSKNKQVVVGQANNPSSSPKIGEKPGGQAAQKAFHVQSEEVVNNRIVVDQQDAQDLAQSIIDELSHSFIQVEGTCLGNPDIFAGTIIELKGLGKRFSDKYLISRAMHRYNKTAYTTSFEVSGHSSNTLGRLLGGDTHQAHGVVVGIVTNNNDPDKLGRVKIKYPAISDDCESDWAKLVSPMAGADRGIAFFPEVNDEVLVAFENDDIHRPYVLGSLWNNQDKPPQAVYGGGNPSLLVIHSVSGHTIVLDDTGGSEKISIIDKGQKNSIIIDSNTNSIEVQANSGPKVTINKPTGTVAVDDAAGNSVKMSSSGVEITAAAKLSLKAPQINIEAQAQLSMKASAKMDIESAMTSVKGSVALALEGGLVKIN